MPAEELTHNRKNGVTGGIWRENGVVHKLLTHRRTVPAEWASSGDPTHWNYWRREALVHETALPARLGLSAPALLDIVTRPDGDLELLLEDVPGAHSATLTLDDITATARALGRSQGRRDLPTHPWLSRNFLRAYSTTRPVDWTLLDDDSAWSHPLIKPHFPPSLRASLRAFHHDRARLLSLAEKLPRTVCHLDVWPNNIIRRPTGEVVLLDWSFTGDGALGEDMGNLIPDSVWDRLLPHTLLPELDTRVTAAYLDGLTESGWTGDPRLVRLAICTTTIKYDWLTPLCLTTATAAGTPTYGGTTTTDPAPHYAARAAGLHYCTERAREAERLARELGLW